MWNMRWHWAWAGAAAQELLQEVGVLLHLLPLGSELGTASSGNYSFLHSSEKFGFAEEQGGLADFGSCAEAV